jgi:tetratricopeptide (TPR) repeat protein
MFGYELFLAGHIRECVTYVKKAVADDEMNKNLTSLIGLCIRQRWWKEMGDLCSAHTNSAASNWDKRDLIAMSMAKKGDADAAAVLQRKILAERTAEQGVDAQDTLLAKTNLGLTLITLNQLDEAEILLKEAEENVRIQLKDDDRNCELYLITCRHLAHWFTRKKDYASAVEMLSQAIKLGKESESLNEIAVLMAEKDLAIHYLDSGKYALGETILRHVLDRRIELLGYGHHDTVKTVRRLLFLYEEQGRIYDLRDMSMLYQRCIGYQHGRRESSPSRT